MVAPPISFCFCCFCPNVPGAEERPGRSEDGSRPCPVSRSVVRKSPAYFAASTRVLSAEYNPELRKEGVRMVSFPDFTRHFFVL